MKRIKKNKQFETFFFKSHILNVFFIENKKIDQLSEEKENNNYRYCHSLFAVEFNKFSETYIHRKIFEYLNDENILFQNIFLSQK